MFCVRKIQRFLCVFTSVNPSICYIIWKFSFAVNASKQILFQCWLTHRKQLVFLLFIDIFLMYNNALTGVSGWKHEFSWKINVCKCKKTQWFPLFAVCITHWKCHVFLSSEPFFAWLTKCSQEFSSWKHAFSNISSQWWIRANSMKRIFWRFTVYYCLVNPWKIRVFLPVTAILRTPTSYSLE